MILLATNFIENTRRFLASILFVIIIAVASFSNYHQIINLFWFSALTKFVVFGLLGILGILLISIGQLNIRSVGTIDIVFFTFIIYTLGNSISKSLPNLPSEDSYSLILFLIFYILIRFHFCRQKGAQLEIILIGITILAIIQAFLGLLQEYGFILHYTSSFRASGTFINPGIYGCFLMIGLLICIHQLVNGTNTTANNIIYSLISIFLLLALIYSGSRTSWLALCGGFLCIYFVKSHNAPILNRLKKFLVLLVWLGLIIGVYFVIQMNTLSVDGRFLIWKISKPMFTVNPMTGLGYGAFFIQYGNYQANYFLNGNGSESEIQLASMNYYSFNEYLKILIEGGIIGLLLFILLLRSIVVFIYRNIAALEGRDHLLSLTVFSIGSALMLFALFSYPSQDFSISLILLSLLSWAGHKQAEDPESWCIKLPCKKIASYYIAVVCGLIIFASIIKTKAILKWKTAKENILVQEGESLNTYANILPILSNNGVFLYNYGAELNDLEMLSEANAILRSAAIYGNSVELQLKIAENFLKLGKVGVAEQYYLKAAYMNPKLFVPFNILLDFYQKTDQKIKAQELAKFICKKSIKISSSEVLEIKDRACEYLKQ